jgi:hypothetical protein
MLLRRLFEILRAGLVAFQTRPELYNIVLHDYLGLPEIEAAKIRAALLRTPVRLQHGYPAKSIQMPCMALILQSESQSQKYLGGVAYLADPTKVGEGSMYEHSSQLLIYSENIDLTIALYEIARAILTLSSRQLAEAGIDNPRFTGMDIAPDRAYLPENVFCRILGIAATYPYALAQLLEGAGAATMLGGLVLPPGTDRTDDYASGVTITGTQPG